jgi:hypothetical protein
MCDELRTEPAHDIIDFLSTNAGDLMDTIIDSCTRLASNNAICPEHSCWCSCRATLSCSAGRADTRIRAGSGSMIAGGDVGDALLGCPHQAVSSRSAHRR